MYRILVIYFLLILPTFCKSQTIIPPGAEVSGKWVRDSSPYWVMGEVTVIKGEKLEIEEGVAVHFKVNEDTARYSESEAGTLMVKGRLVAKGTERAPIIFTRIGHGGNWGVVFVDSLSKGSLFDHCIIKHAGLLNDVRHEAVNYGGLSFFGSVAQVWNCVFIGNRSYGVTCHGDAAPSFYNCLIVGNYGAGVGIFSGKPIFEKTTIADNSAEGVYCRAEAAPLFKKSVIVGNEGTVRSGAGHLDNCILDARPFGSEITTEDIQLVNPGPTYLDWVLDTGHHDLLGQWAAKGIGAPTMKDAESIARLLVHLREQ